MRFNAPRSKVALLALVGALAIIATAAAYLLVSAIMSSLEPKKSLEAHFAGVSTLNPAVHCGDERHISECRIPEAREHSLMRS